MKFILAAILAFPTLTAHAAQIEVGAGVAQAQTTNGLWYQNGFAHSLKTRAPAFMVGLTGAISPHIGWHIDAVDLGRYSVNSWDTPNDANYSGHGYRGNALPLANYIGSGSVYGIAATLEAHTSGAWQAGIEAGPFLYHATWDLRVPDWYPSVEVRPFVFQQSGPARPISYSQSHWKIGYVVGATLRRGAWALSLRMYQDGHGFSGHGSDGWAPLWSSQTVAMVTYTF
ncbi:MAG: hypothetical protein WC829_01650 [Hyphomicrobium sp.]|jgi:hypothetical protein